MWTIILKTAIQIAAGVGLADLFDRFVKPVVPVPIYPEPIGIGFRIPRIAWVLGTFIVAVMVLKFIGKKMKISILK